MTRLPYLRYDDLDAAGQQVWDGVVGSRGSRACQRAGRPGRPVQRVRHAPGVGRHLSSLGGRLRFRTSIERRLSEVAIITVGARWKAEFEWWAHARMAREHGVADAVVDAIGRGEDPPFEADDERTVYAVARQLTGPAGSTRTATPPPSGCSATRAWSSWSSLCGYYTPDLVPAQRLRRAAAAGAAPMWGARRGA